MSSPSGFRIIAPTPILPLTRDQSLSVHAALCNGDNGGDDIGATIDKREGTIAFAIPVTEEILATVADALHLPASALVVA